LRQGIHLVECETYETDFRGRQRFPTSFEVGKKDRKGKGETNERFEKKKEK